MRPPKPGEPQCSFCGKPKGDVRQLTASASVFICNECVDLCTQIIAEEVPGWIDEHAELVAGLVAERAAKRPT